MSGCDVCCSGSLVVNGKGSAQVAVTLQPCSSNSHRQVLLLCCILQLHDCLVLLWSAPVRGDILLLLFLRLLSPQELLVMLFQMLHLCVVTLQQDLLLLVFLLVVLLLAPLPLLPSLPLPSLPALFLLLLFLPVLEGVPAQQQPWQEHE